MRRAGRVLAALATIALASLVVFLGLGRWLEAPGMEPADADVIVLLGGDSEARLDAVLDLYRQHWASRIYVVGSANTARSTDAPRAHARENFLQENGVPASAIVVDEGPRNSKDEAAATLAAMRKFGWRSALVVSDPPHMRRLSWIWRRAFDGSGLAYALVPSRAAWWHEGAWWRDEWSREFVRNEIAKIGYYLATRG